MKSTLLQLVAVATPAAVAFVVTLLYSASLWAQGLEVKLDGCERLAPAGHLRRLVRLELESGQRNHSLVRARIDCGDDAIYLSLLTSSGERHARSVQWPPPEHPDPARLLALQMAQLHEAHMGQIGSSSIDSYPAATAPAGPAPQAAWLRHEVRIGAGATWRSISFTPMAKAQVSYAYSLAEHFAVQAAGALQQRSFSVELGDVQARLTELKAGARGRVAAAGRATLWLGGYVGATHFFFAGSSARPAVRTDTVSGLRVGGNLVVGAQLSGEQLAVELGAEVGFVPRGPRATIGDDDILVLDGLWGGLLLQGVWRL